jgi:hypothetical protein
MSITLTTDMSLDKRIAEIKKQAKNNKYAYEYYIDEYYSLIDLKAKIKGEKNDNNNY